MVKILRQSRFGDEVSAVRDGMIHLRTGAPRAIIGTSSLNFDGLAPEQQLRAVQAFRDLLHAQSGPFQLYLRIRRVPVGEAKEPDAGAFPDRQAYLAAMTRSFISAHLQDAPVYQREIYLVVAPLQTGRQMLRSWLFRFDRSRDDPSFVASDLGTPLANRARSPLDHRSLYRATRTAHRASRRACGPGASGDR